MESRRQPRLGRARDTLFGRPERGQQRLHAAGELRLLLRQPDGRLDIHHQVLIARARQALHQLLELGALQGHLVKSLVQMDDREVQVTATGWYFIRAIAMVFDRHLQSDRARERFSRII